MIPKEKLDEIKKIGEEEINKKLFLSDEDFDKLRNPSIDLNENKENYAEELKEVYRNLIDILKDWLDLREDYYKIIALWIFGTYLHEQFPTYPYLFFNAMRGSGKSRTLKLVTHLSKEGALLNSLTEAEIFRSKGTLGIDEFEGITRKGMENLRELLNSGYKRGVKVRRMKKLKTLKGEEQVVEEFNVYRPICMANINGMEDVLSDRCINLTLEKSSKSELINMIEIFEYDEKIKSTIQLINRILSKKKDRCSLCSVVSLQNIYKEWNIFIKQHIHIYNNYNKYTNNTTTKDLFNKIKDSNINGRELELSFPFFILSSFFNDEDEVIETLSKIMKERKEEGLIENRDISLYDFLSQEEEIDVFVSVNRLTDKFKQFLQTNDETINSKWMGRALKRLNLIVEKRRINIGVEVKLNYSKAKEKIKMFK